MPIGQTQGFVATGNIYPRRFVKASGTDGKVTQCGSGELPLGVSGQGTRRPQYIDSNGYHASANEPCLVYGLGEECEIELAGTVNQGDRLASDGNGKATATTTDQVQYGGFALMDGVSGQTILMRVQPGEVSN